MTSVKPRRLLHGHVLLKDGQVYCEEKGNSAAPVVTHSRVKCRLCGAVVASLHGGPSENPSHRAGWEPYDAYTTKELAQKYAEDLKRVYPKWSVQVSYSPADGGARTPWTLFVVERNPSRGHISADIKAFDRVTREMKKLKSRDRRELRQNPAPIEYPAGGGWVVREYPYGDAPIVVMHNKRNGRLAYLMDTEEGFKWSHASDVPAKVKDRAIAVLVHRRRPSFYRTGNPVPSYAMILRRKLAKGHDQEEAEELARRELQQASEFLRVPYSESRRRNPAKERLILWGFHPDISPTPIKLSEYTRADQVRREKEGWTTGAYRKGDSPDGLILQSRRLKNPASGPVKIYGKTERIFMTKTSGPYKGKRFVHDFKPGVQQIGFPRGTVLKAPDGRTFRMTTRSVLLTGKKDLYRNFPA